MLDLGVHSVPVPVPDSLQNWRNVHTLADFGKRQERQNQFQHGTLTNGMEILALRHNRSSVPDKTRFPGLDNRLQVRSDLESPFGNVGSQAPVRIRKNLPLVVNIPVQRHQQREQTTKSNIGVQGVVIQVVP
ncbi:hypothetical protein OGAPHI_005728 [Ogataea philodendri]|uniref:Uncharacterized protein n=1 Tax=Ogataea philodendri TaxID=1378263 RepID=A0A9P8T1F3_9ASCO|nr:uncharacterized protein OGAPHI_005728 [Ogataea philodendri]KAH3662476.1 hypothetical protein OGAPHI_005728 [Ogataea philodendri]